MDDKGQLRSDIKIEEDDDLGKEIKVKFEKDEDFMVRYSTCIYLCLRYFSFSYMFPIIRSQLYIYVMTIRFYPTLNKGIICSALVRSVVRPSSRIYKSKMFITISLMNY